MNEEALMRDLARRLLERSRGEAVDMGRALQGGDLAAIAATAHRMAGAAGALGFDALDGIARRLQRAAEARDTASVAELLEAMRGDLDRLR